MNERWTVRRLRWFIKVWLIKCCRRRLACIVNLGASFYESCPFHIPTDYNTVFAALMFCYIVIGHWVLRISFCFVYGAYINDILLHSNVCCLIFQELWGQIIILNISSDKSDFRKWRRFVIIYIIVNRSIMDIWLYFSVDPFLLRTYIYIL